MARLWHSVILCRWNPIFEYIPIESQIEKFQNEYYDVIDRCHGVGESTQFIEFMLTQIDSLMGEVIPRRKVSSGEISDNVGKLLSVMDLDIPYTGRELMDRLELSSREGFRRNYLRPALEADAIQMTIPDKPRSRNQKYIRR